MTGTHKRAREAVILAAGKGRRMRSRRPKVLHEVAGRPLLGWVLDAARGAGVSAIRVIVGHGSDDVRRRLAAPDVTWVEQDEQLGTGHALAQVEGAVTGPAWLLVLSGDVPLVSPRTLVGLLAAAERGWGAMAVAELAEPGTLGRVVADDGKLVRIVEASDASPEELKLTRVNAGIYALPAPEIFRYLDALEPRNQQGELYLTDALGAAAAAGHEVRLLDLERPSEALGVNSQRDLVRVRRALARRKIEELLDSGVTVWEPERTMIEPAVEVGRDSSIEAGVTLLGTTRVGEGCVLRQGAWLRDSTLAAGVVVEPYSVVDGAEVGTGCRVGPFARLRPGTVLESGARVGNFVETKKTRLGAGAKANHHAYLGDATIGEGTNIGAGTITCNYDGRDKHPTVVGRGAFIGSDTMLVAPVEIGDEAVTGAGSVITRDVPRGALGVSRGAQRNIPGWSERRRPRGDEEDDQ